MSRRRATGMGRFVLLPVPPSPSWPSQSAPQATTVPSVFTAKENESPAAMLATPLNPGTIAGVARAVLVPSPSSPQ